MSLHSSTPYPRRLARALLIAVAFAAGAPRHPARADALDATALCQATIDELRSGRVRVIERPPTDGQGVALRACGVVDAPPAAVWDVLRDCGKFDQFLPRVSQSTLESRNDDIVICDETIDLPFPLGDLHSVSRVVESQRPNGGFERRWSLVHGTYRRLEGGWVVIPWDEARSQSLVIYEVDMDPETVIPDFLIRRTQAGAAVDVYQAVRRRVRQCTDATQALACASE